MANLAQINILEALIVFTVLSRKRSAVLLRNQAICLHCQREIDNLFHFNPETSYQPDLLVALARAVARQYCSFL